MKLYRQYIYNMRHTCPAHVLPSVLTYTHTLSLPPVARKWVKLQAQTLTHLVHKGFRQALAFDQHRERVPAIIALMEFPNLHCVVRQVVMDDERSVLAKHVLGVIPYGVEAKDLQVLVSQVRAVNPM